LDQAAKWPLRRQHHGNTQSLGSHAGGVALFRSDERSVRVGVDRRPSAAHRPRGDPVRLNRSRSLLKRERQPSSYKLRIASDAQRIEWIAGQDKNEVVHIDEPNATCGQQLRLSLVSMFVQEDLL
jgi:hypothetical protein